MEIHDLINTSLEQLELGKKHDNPHKVNVSIAYSLAAIAIMLHRSTSEGIDYDGKHVMALRIDTEPMTYRTDLVQRRLARLYMLNNWPDNLKELWSPAERLVEDTVRYSGIFSNDEADKILDDKTHWLWKVAVEVQDGFFGYRKESNDEHQEI